METDPTQLSKDRLIVLPFTKSVEIAFRSLKARFFRSLITVISLVLAVSFFGYVQVSNNVADGLLAKDDVNLRQMLVRQGYDISPEDTSVNTDPKQRWILALSLLVCVVGIVNAQLMAVTERFREIGTMKCLGALDRFVLRLFLLEAAMQGIAGAILGAALGGFTALVISVFRYGAVIFQNLSVGAIGVSMTAALAVGCLLSLAGVLYPALVAARMQPVEAMRVEQ